VSDEIPGLHHSSPGQRTIKKKKINPLLDLATYAQELIESPSTKGEFFRGLGV
jgi:hypothetical protein